jgi:hypothetical protein
MAYDYDDHDVSEDEGLDELGDEAAEEDEESGEVDPYEDFYGDDDDEFPEEEEDEDNPDWYRLPEPGDRGAIETQAGSEESSDDDLPLDSPDGELFRHYVGEDDEDGVMMPTHPDEEVVAQPATAGDLDLLYDAEGYYGYVLIRRRDGDVTRADVKAVSDALKSERVMVVRDGASQRAAVNGVQYSWYLRVQRQGGAKPAADVVKRVLRQVATPPTPRMVAGEAQAVASRRIATLEARLAFQSEETASLRAANDRLRRELAQVRAMDQAARQRELEAEDEHVSRIQRVLGALSQIRNDADGEHKRAELLASERDRVAAEAAARIAVATEEQVQLARMADEELVLRNRRIEELTDQLCRTENERDQLAVDRDRVASELAAHLETVRATRDQNARRASSVDFGKVLDALLPSITLMPGSTDVMLMELADPTPVLRLLCRVASDGHCHGQSAVRGAPGWYDVHYSTGQKDDGRLYFARRKTGGWIALVTRKTARSEQDRDIERLRRAKL